MTAAAKAPACRHLKGLVKAPSPNTAKAVKQSRPCGANRTASNINLKGIRKMFSNERCRASPSGTQGTIRPTRPRQAALNDRTEARRAPRP